MCLSILKKSEKQNLNQFIFKWNKLRVSSEHDPHDQYPNYVIFCLLFYSIYIF